MSEATSIQRAIRAILARYVQARAGEVFGPKNAIWPEFETVAQGLARAPFLASFPTIRIRRSAGIGRWATVPWFAAMDERETSRPSEGVYVVYLFRADMSGLYLTLSQGAGRELLVSGERGFRELERRAELLRVRAMQGLERAGFASDRIDLHSSARLVRGYEASTVAHKFYERGSVPRDDALLADFEALVRIYAQLVPSRKILGTR